MKPHLPTNTFKRGYFFCRRLRRVGTARLLLLLSLSAVTTAGQAQFTFTTNSGKVTLTKYTGFGGAVTIPNWNLGMPVTTIGSQAFYGSAITSVTIGTNVTSIADEAFQYCSSLTSIVIPNNVRNISWDAFADCDKMTNAMIGTRVNILGGDAFSRCGTLTAIMVDPNNATFSSVDGVLFDKNQSTLIKFPGGKAGNYAVSPNVTSIANGAFAISYKLLNVTIPDSVTGIGEQAFKSCTSLKSVTLGSNVISIGAYAFEGCNKLTGITLPATVAYIWDGAFYGCSLLTNISIPTATDLIGGAAFNHCLSLSTITVETNNLSYRSQDGVLFNKDLSTLIQYPAGKAGAYSVPNAVTNIGAGAFAECSLLTEVTIGSGVGTIESSAFSMCYALAKVIFPGRLASIGNGAFAWCYSLTNITIPKSVTMIGSGAFDSCIYLTEIYFQGDPPTADATSFSGDTTATAYYLPEAVGWTDPWQNLRSVLWNPQAQTTDAGFGVHTNQFGFNVTGTPNIPIVVEACVDLAEPSWTSLQSFVLTNGSIYFSDPGWTKYPVRFYRLRSP